MKTLTEPNRSTMFEINMNEKNTGRLKTEIFVTHVKYLMNCVNKRQETAYFTLFPIYLRTEFPTSYN